MSEKSSDVDLCAPCVGLFKTVLQSPAKSSPAVYSNAKRDAMKWSLKEAKLDMERETFVLYSHFHHDHLQGLPFNASVFSHNEPIYLSSALVNRNVLRNMVQTYFSGGYFPVDIVNVLKQLKFMNVATIQRKLAPKIELDVIELNHPGGSMGYSRRGEARPREERPGCCKR